MCRFCLTSEEYAAAKKSYQANKDSFGDAATGYVEGWAQAWIELRPKTPCGNTETLKEISKIKSKRSRTALLGMMEKK